MRIKDKINHTTREMHKIEYNTLIFFNLVVDLILFAIKYIVRTTNIKKSNIH